MITEDREFIAMAHDDWLVTAYGHRLHALTYLIGLDGETQGTVRLACGRATWACIPGPFTRMGADRCARCCDVTGYPRGKGSPKNDPACAAALETTP